MEIKSKYRRLRNLRNVQGMSWLNLLLSYRYSPAVLLLVNMVPLVCVLFFDWKVFTLIVLYWAENLIVGIMNVVKMVTVMVITKAWGKGISNIPFFILHYGFFALAHGLFVLILFGPGKQYYQGILASFLLLPLFQEQPLLMVGLVGLFIHHFASFLIHFIGAGEYKEKIVDDLMFPPYGRVIVLHIAILGGGFLVEYADEPIWALVVLVGVKIGIDLGAHIFSHMPVDT